MDIQALFNAISKSAADERSNYHVCLGGLIDALAEVPPQTNVWFSDGQCPKEFMSYRGYYSDLSISSSGSHTTASELLKKAKDALGQGFMGYKGGDFIMDRKTPIWQSEYGSASGVAVIATAYDDGNLILITKLIDP